MQKIVSLMFLVLFSLAGTAIASETADGDMSASNQESINNCTAAGQESELQGEELSAYIESCLQESTMSSGEEKSEGSAD